ncbi:MAG: hypothetical protein JXD22_08635 [Sedimentisphaerales bacterium]|nr:hypothetical protein [Sedimentisphaerales bacterium]
MTTRSEAESPARNDEIRPGFAMATPRQDDQSRQGRASTGDLMTNDK